MESETKNLVRELWQAFWEGGITDTLRVVEQISYLIFMKRIEVLDDATQSRAEATNEKYESIFAKLDENGENYDDCRWST